MSFFTTIFLIVFYSVFVILLSKMGSKLPSSLGAAIFSCVSGLLAFGYYMYERLSFKTSLLATSTMGLWYAVIAGVVIGIWNVVLILVFARGANISYVQPLVYGLGAVAIPTCVGVFFFKESISLVQGFGISFILLGFGLVVFSKLSV